MSDERTKEGVLLIAIIFVTGVLWSFSPTFLSVLGAKIRFGLLVCILKCILHIFPLRETHHIFKPRVCVQGRHLMREGTL